MTISLSFKDATKPLEFYQKAFGAEQRALVIGPGGQGVIHSELRIGDTILILADDIGMTGKTVDEGYAAAFVPHLWVTDADATWKRALDAGRKEHMPLAMQFWGDRYGQILDPFGLRWAIATHVEDVSDEEMNTRMAKEMAKR